MLDAQSATAKQPKKDRPLSPEAVLAALPQQHPFRFIDRILAMDDQQIVGQYRFREDEYFYQGHFPGDPVTPGVILTETMAQTGLVAFGLYLVSQMDTVELSEIRTVFTESNVEFLGTVRPGDQVTVKARKIYFRRFKLKVAAEMTTANGDIVCSGELAGIGVKTK